VAGIATTAKTSKEKRVNDHATQTHRPTSHKNPFTSPFHLSLKNHSQTFLLEFRMQYHMQYRIPDKESNRRNQIKRKTGDISICMLQQSRTFTRLQATWKAD
jgi:hypothetical protein